MIKHSYMWQDYTKVTHKPQAWFG